MREKAGRIDTTPKDDGRKIYTKGNAFSSPERSRGLLPLFTFPLLLDRLSEYVNSITGGYPDLTMGASCSFESGLVEFWIISGDAFELQGRTPPKGRARKAHRNHQAETERFMSEQGLSPGAGEQREESTSASSQAIPVASPISLSGGDSWHHLLLFLEISPDALVLIDAAGRIEAVNSQAAALFGYLRAELEGEPLERLLPERFHEAHHLHRERFATAPRSRPMGAGLALFGRRHDGSEFPVDISLSPFFVASTLHVLAAIRDMTERHRLQEREHAARVLAEARLALLQLVLDELPISVVLVQGKEARLVLANQATMALWGAQWLSDQPLLDFLAAHQLRLFDPNGRTLHPATLATMRALHEGQAVRQYQEVIHYADGTTLPVLVNAVPLSLPLLHGVEELEEHPSMSPVEPAALVVHQDVATLKEAERLKDQFLGLVAHELRNPLAALKGLAAMLLRYAQGDKGAPLAP